MNLFELRQDGTDYLFAFDKEEPIYKCIVSIIGLGGWHRSNFRDTIPGRRVSVNKMSDRLRQNLISNIFDLKKAWWFNT